MVEFVAALAAVCGLLVGSLFVLTRLVAGLQREATEAALRAVLGVMGPQAAGGAEKEPEGPLLGREDVFEENPWAREQVNTPAEEEALAGLLMPWESE